MKPTGLNDLRRKARTRAAATAADPSVSLDADPISKKGPTDIDRHIASRIRRRRLDIGMSQEQLAAAIGVTFQQVQKYEKGTNRISASRLHQVADALKVDVQYFFGGLETSEPPPVDPTRSLYEDRATLELARAFSGIMDEDVRSALLQLARALAPSAISERPRRPVRPVGPPRSRS